MTFSAQAHPEKRLFISLLTRDISLADAFLDLLDNSINAALKALGLKDGTAADYISLINSDSKPSFSITINFDRHSISIVDNCGGISFEDAKSKVFIFGADDNSHHEDRLSVYGIGLKRAMFKLGDQIEMESDHIEQGFSLSLFVPVWEAKKEERWTFDIDSRPSSKSGRTIFKVTKLHEAVISRLGNPTFETDLLSRISKAYSFFIARIVTIKLNGTMIEAEEPRISSTTATESFEVEGVSIDITAGIGIPKNDRYETERAGWNIYCNGRAIVFYDRTPLTGWGVEGFLPSFQPKFRPFVGMVFFTSNEPEKLPWTTTKLGVNPDNLIWQRALQRMADIGKQVTKFLDSRYGEEGTTITTAELADAIGKGTVVQPALSRPPTMFSPPKSKVDPTTSIQYRVRKDQLQRAKTAIGRQSMSNGEVGLYTFNYFIDNECPDG